MPASEAQIRANRENAAKSTGPKTAEGKEASRRNALKHGMTGAGVVLPESAAVEVDRRTRAFEAELGASGEVGQCLARHAALCSVRMEWLADQQTVALAERVRLAEADAEIPEGATPQQAGQIRIDAGRKAMFDPSDEAARARKYEAEAARGFFRAIKELRQQKRETKAQDSARSIESAREILASFSDGKDLDAEFDAMYQELGITPPPTFRNPAGYPPVGARIDVPIGLLPRK